MSLALSAAVCSCTTCEFFLSSVLVSELLHEWFDDGVIRFDPVRGEVPLLAVPGMDTCRARALMIQARGADWLHHCAQTEFVERFLIQCQVLQTPTDLFACHDLAFAEAALRLAHAFHSQRCADHATVVKHGAHFFRRACTHLLAVHVCLDVSKDLAAFARHHQAVVALGCVAHVFDVWLSCGPPNAVHFFAWVTCGHSFFQSSRVHHTPAPQQHIVRASYYLEGMDRKFIFSIQKKIFNKVHPDITFLIDLNKKESKIRINKRSKKTNKFDKLSSYHFNKIRNGFLKISKMYKNKIVLIKGNKSLNEIQKVINKKTLKILNERL